MAFDYDPYSFLPTLGALDMHLASEGRHEDLHDAIAGRLNKVEGVLATQTLIAFQAYSKHDLEATFSLGMEA